jgi:hypothetical protein
MNASWYRRFLLVPFTLLVSLTLFTSAFAAKPEMFTIAVDDTFVLGDCNGFSVIEHVEGTVKVSTHFDKDGNFTMEIVRFGLRHTYTNSETGASLSSPDVGIDKVGSGEVNVIGIVSRIVVPGEGLVFAHLGKIVFEAETGEVLFVAGPHDDLADLLPALCSGLD